MTDSTLTNPPPLALDRALEQLGRLRRLARSLGADAATAEDAAQETLRRAFEQREFGAADGRWLDGILRNVLRFMGRTAVRRRDRERAVARPEATAGTLDAIARAEMFRALTDAIAKLPLRTQQCVMLRYFDELSPRCIADRLGLPRRQVYKHLEQGRALLRERLLRAGVEFDSAAQKRRAAWLGGLVGWPWWRLDSVPARATRWTGLCMGILMTKVWLAGCIAIGVACVAAWIWLDEPSELPAPMALDRAVEQPEAESQSAVPAKVAGSREAVGQPSTEAAPLPVGQHEFAMDFHVFDRDDLPAQFAQVLVAPAGQPLNALSVDSDGVARLRFLGHRRELELVYGLGAFGDAPAVLRRVRLVAGQAPAVAALKSDYFRAESDPSNGGSFMVSLGSYSVRRGAFDMVPSLAKDGDEWQQFTVPIGRPETQAKTLAGRLLSTATVSGVRRTGVTLFPSKPPSPASTKLAGIVYDAGGRPAIGATVIAQALGDPNGELSSQPSDAALDAWLRSSARVARTDDEGRFALAMPPGEYRLRAGGGDFGLAETRRVMVDGQDAQWSPRLARGTEFGGTLRDSAGALAGWTVQIEGLDGQVFVDRTEVGDDGRFSMPNVPCAQCRVMVRPPKSQMWSVLTQASPVRADLKLVVPHALGSVVAWARSASDEDATAEIRIWSTSSGLGLRFQRSGKAVEAALLPMDSYRVMAAGESMQFGPPALVTLSEAQPDAKVADLPIEGAAPVEISGLSGLVDSQGKRLVSIRLERDSKTVTSVGQLHLPTEGDALTVLLPFGRWSLVGAPGRTEQVITKSEPLDWAAAPATAPSAK